MAEELMAVGCKAPAGIVLNLDTVDADERTGRVRIIPGKIGPVTLSGWSYDRLEQPDPTLATGGYAITMAPKAFMDEWLSRNKDSPLLADRIIIISEKGDGTAKARDNADAPKMFDQWTPPADSDGRKDKD
jgi:hypothetical protein